ncbi:MAG: cytidine deaminase [Ruminococcaceae bacterium]|nr:cytidine deaminase [Oscillospiraceae bacterium]
MTDFELMAAAEQARERAYSPYSDFKVGAALLTKRGSLYLGCNIENAAFTPTVCAERVAFFEAIKNGERDFEAIAIVGGKVGEKPTFCSPCGVCRQVMTEFCQRDFRILLGTKENFTAYTIADLFPLSFSPQNLQ